MEKFDLDINEKLDNLIIKYKVDSPFPKYKKYLWARHILETLCERVFKSNDHIYVVGNTISELGWFKDCVGDKYEVTAYFEENEIDKIESGQVLYVSINNKLNYDIINLKKDIIVFNIYDEFKKEGLEFSSPFFDIFELEYYSFKTGEKTREWDDVDYSRIFFEFRVEYEAVKSTEGKINALKKLIFLCAYAKDFLFLKKYIDIYCKLSGEAEFKDFWNAVDNLLKEMRSFFLRREKKDIIVFWLDALEYGEDADMKFLKSLDKVSSVFNHAYTVTPYTGPTFRMLFTGERPIEEKSFNTNQIDKSNSNVIRLLEEKEYDFKYYGPLRLVTKEHRGRYRYFLYATITQLCWDAIRDAILHPEKSHFIVLHEECHTHQPFISFGLTGSEYTSKEIRAGHQVDKSNEYKSAMESKAYLDDQLRFWSDLLSEKSVKIYMSDHGHTHFGRYHTLFKVNGRGMPAKYIDDLFSYKYFGTIVENILFDRNLTENVLLGDFIQIQDVDYYNKDFILEYIKNPNFDVNTLLGYQGVVTREDLLIKHRNGKLLYQKHKTDETMVTDERIKLLENIISDDWVDTDVEEKFLYSRIYLRADKKCIKREAGKEQAKKRIVEEIFKGIKDTEGLIIRGGGMHTLHMLMDLPYEQRIKIRYIIDNDKNCLGAKLGVKVIGLKEAKETGINTVLISSFFYREEMKNEARKVFPVVIDIYEEFEKQGIICTKDYYKKDFRPEDFKE